ncbi:diguanylate cyclase [Amycolatopsis samaneae]
MSLARRWAAKLADTEGVTLPPDELEPLLLEFAREAAPHLDPAHEGALLRFTTLYAASPTGIALADREGVVVEANAALGKLLGTSPELVRGRHLTELGAGEHDATRLRAGLLQLRAPDGEQYTERLRLDHAQDGPLWTDVKLIRLPGDRPGTAYPVLMATDANENQLLQERLRHQNVHDALTGLANGTAFQTKLGSVVETGAGEQIALVYLDIDGFKVINDGLGAGVGDQVLRGIAHKLSAAFAGRFDGEVFRLAGDGFAILLHGELTSNSVSQLVQQALDELNEPIYLDGHGIGASASAGIVVRSVRGCEASDLARAAEIALHRAKEAGKAQWMLFDPELDARDRGRYQLGAVLAGALENGQFSLIYQPTVKLARPDQLAAVNAGLRWNHPERGELDSDEFYPLAETTGMTIPLGKWLLAESLAATARWRDRFGEAAPDVCVRLPNRLAIEPDLVRLVKEQLDRHGLPAKALRLCADPASVLDQHGEVLDSFAVLADLGAQLVLTVSGSADLELIPHHRLPVHHVILSGPVVDVLAEDAAETDARHLRQLVSRAKELKLRIGAEGVRTDEQAARLRELGVLAARGPFVTESATGDEVDELIARHAS